MSFPFVDQPDLLRGAVGLVDGLGGDDIVAAAVAGTAVLTFCLLLFGKIVAPVIRRINIFLDWLEKFREDWDGTPEVKGRAATPGVMERLNRIDGEFQRNGGGSMKDTLVAAVAGTQTNGQRLDGVIGELAQVKETVNSMVSPTAGGADNRINTDGSGT